MQKRERQHGTSHHILTLIQSPLMSVRILLLMVMGFESGLSGPMVGNTTWPLLCGCVRDVMRDGMWLYDSLSLQHHRHGINPAEAPAPSLSRWQEVGNGVGRGYGMNACMQCIVIGIAVAPTGQDPFVLGCVQTYGKVMVSAPKSLQCKYLQAILRVAQRAAWKGHMNTLRSVVFLQILQTSLRSKIQGPCPSRDL